MAAADLPTTKHPLPTVLRMFLLVSVLLTLACLAAERYSRHTPALNYPPYTHITLEPSDDYADYRMFVGRFHRFHQQDFFSPQYGSHFLYPATVAVLSTPFYIFPPPAAPERRFLR